MAIQFVVAVILIMRVYALYDRRRWVIWLFIIIAGADVAVGCWGVISDGPTTIPPIGQSVPGCMDPVGSKQGVHLAIAWSGQLGFDTLVFFLTLKKSFEIGRTGHRTLINILLRDGAVYFAIMTAANLGNILTLLLASPISKGVSSTCVNVISATTVSRLMLNLRDPKILNPISKRTTEGTTVASSNPVVSTLLDSRLSPPNVDEEAEVASPNDGIEMIPRS